MLVVDATRGEAILAPDPETLKWYRDRYAVEAQRAQELTSVRDLPAVTIDGVRVHLGANVESIAGISAALSAGAESIGLSARSSSTSTVRTSRARRSSTRTRFRYCGPPAEYP
jgi:phosphoenolpyruvate-protein kinase (PTS system EI component)